MWLLNSTTYSCKICGQCHFTSSKAYFRCLSRVASSCRGLGTAWITLKVKYQVLLKRFWQKGLMKWMVSNFISEDCISILSIFVCGENLCRKQQCLENFDCFACFASCSTYNAGIYHRSRLMLTVKLSPPSYRCRGKSRGQGGTRHPFKPSCPMKCPKCPLTFCLPPISAGCDHWHPVVRFDLHLIGCGSLWSGWCPFWPWSPLIRKLGSVFAIALIFLCLTTVKFCFGKN